jgi:hypothetical protein
MSVTTVSVIIDHDDRLDIDKVIEIIGDELWKYVDGQELQGIAEFDIRQTSTKE